MCLRPSVLRCWRALLLCVIPFCNLFPRTYVRRRLIPYYDSGPLHKHQIYIRPMFHFVPLVESGIFLFVDVATLSTIYDVRHPLLLPPGYPTQVHISRPQAVRPPSSTPPGCPKREKKRKKYATIFPPFSLRLPFQPLPVLQWSQAPASVVSRVCLRPFVLRCWRALLLCVIPFCNLFPRTYVRTPTPYSILRFRPAPQTPDLHTSNLPLCSAR